MLTNAYRATRVALPVLALLLSAVVVSAQEQAAPQPGAGGAEEKGILQVAGDAGNFKTFCELVQLAGLEEALGGPGPFTVFAPTDEAFAKLSKEALEDLKKPENKEQLQKVLKYHVVRGKADAAAVAKSKALRTLQPKHTIKVSEKEGKVVLNENVNIVKADIAAKNGVIHSIDTVLTPTEELKPEKPEEKPGHE